MLWQCGRGMSPCRALHWAHPAVAAECISRPVRLSQSLSHSATDRPRPGCVFVPLLSCLVSQLQTSVDDSIRDTRIFMCVKKSTTSVVSWLIWNWTVNYGCIFIRLACDDCYSFMDCGIIFEWASIQSFSWRSVAGVDIVNMIVGVKDLTREKRAGQVRMVWQMGRFVSCLLSSVCGICYCHCHSWCWWDLHMSPKVF